MRHLTFSPLVVVTSAILGSCAITPGDTDEPFLGWAEPGDASVSIGVAAETLGAEQPATVLATLQTRWEPTEVVPAQDDACPAGMVLVQGAYCPVAEQTCLNWMEDPAKFPYARCGQFAEPSVCKGKRTALRYCIDKLEAADETGMPIGDISWTDASAGCKKQGKRLCQEHEWLFACEGEELRPYPYGYTRDPSLCNFEKDNLVDHGQLADYRQPVQANPSCLSPFGVQNMVGNIDEWVVLDHPNWKADGRKMMSGLKGGWWGPLRNRCRPVTIDHDEWFHELQTGFRCCAEAK